MLKRARLQWCMLVLFAIAGGFLFGSPHSLSAAQPPRHEPAVRVSLQDTGKTVSLRIGQQLVVALPLQPYPDDFWYVARNFGDDLKLVAGPDTLRSKDWTSSMKSTQLFYFKKQAPGTADLVLEEHYPSKKPMILKVVDQ
jgi:hypothetical protein